MGDRMQITDHEPSTQEVLEFLNDFISFSKQINDLNEKVQDIQKLLIEELKKQGLDLLDLNNN